MADYGGVTPNIGIPYKGDDSVANIDQDNEDAYKIIDAAIQMLRDKVSARESFIVTHEGDGVYSVVNGLGDPVPINNDGDDGYSFVL